MVDVDKAVTARITKHGKHFEILVDCDKALELKHGKEIPLEDVLATKDIFTSVRSAEHAPEDDIKEAFGTTDAEEVSKLIIMEGEIQLTTEHKQKLREQKKKQIIALIARNAINPQTNHPHPPARIESAMDEAKVKIDEFKKAEDQFQEIAKQMNSILPISFETRRLAITIPAQYANQSFNILKTHGKLVQENWNTNGSLLATVELPAGMQEELENQLNKLTHGETQIEIEKGE